MKITHSNFSSPTPIKLKINLENMPLSVFRRVLVPDDVNMMQMHFIIQLAMGWDFAHFFQFSDKRDNPSIIACLPWEEDDEYIYERPVEQFKAHELSLKETFLVKGIGKPFWYWYDFGDSWWHKITFQKPTKKDIELFSGAPVCLEAFGACPPEDVGGPWGYDEFLKVILDKRAPQHAEYRQWAGIPLRAKYDPDYADIQKINNALTNFRYSREWNFTADKYYVTETDYDFE